uniref:Transglutaminase N-terminal domain-containing protein n=1 Tax=Knipowitschia caucasica TaxID=637954 RepID=A0AAV2M4F3_KNICA
MTTLPPKSSSILGVDLKPAQKNAQHHTEELSNQLLIVRRGQSFILDVNFNHPYNGDMHSLLFTVTMGQQANEESGTKCVFGIPDTVTRPVGATSIWRAIVDHKNSYPEMGSLTLIMTPPANAPVGKYSLHLSHAGEEDDLGSLVLLFNPWCIGKQ